MQGKKRKQIYRIINEYPMFFFCHGFFYKKKININKNSERNKSKSMGRDGGKFLGQIKFKTFFKVNFF